MDNTTENTESGGNGAEVSQQAGSSPAAQGHPAPPAQQQAQTTQAPPKGEPTAAGHERPFAPEFGVWAPDAQQYGKTNEVRHAFTNLQEKIAFAIAPGNQRYLHMVKSRLEEACFYAIKGISKPVN